MARKLSRRSAAPVRVVDNGWASSEEYTVGSRSILRPGVEFTVRGEPGAKFRFRRHVVNADGREWIECTGGTFRVTMFRFFRPERVSKVLKPKHSRTRTAA